jgi:hypothetical protein
VNLCNSDVVLITIDDINNFEMYFFFLISKKGKKGQPE